MVRNAYPTAGAHIFHLLNLIQGGIYETALALRHLHILLRLSSPRTIDTEAFDLLAQL